MKKDLRSISAQQVPLGMHSRVGSSKTYNSQAPLSARRLQILVILEFIEALISLTQSNPSSRDERLYLYYHELLARIMVT